MSNEMLIDINIDGIIYKKVVESKEQKFNDDSLHVDIIEVYQSPNEVLEDQEIFIERLGLN
jgi:hypothetical protein